MVSPLTDLSVEGQRAVGVDVRQGVGLLGCWQLLCEASSCDSGVRMQEGGLRWSVLHGLRRHGACQQLCVRFTVWNAVYKNVTYK